MRSLYLDDSLSCQGNRVVSSISRKMRFLYLEGMDEVPLSSGDRGGSSILRRKGQEVPPFI